MPRWNGKWSGGRTYEGRDGQTVYWLDRSWNGKRYGIALNVRSRRDTEAELALFLRDPGSYVEKLEAMKRAAEEKVILKADLFDRFGEHLSKLGRGERHIKGCRHYLDWWLDQLGEVDVRKVTLRDLKRCLGTVTMARRNRIVAWKVFCSFLREETAVLPRGDDASLDLHTPASKPEKAIREKGYSMECIPKLYEALVSWKSDRSGWEEKVPDVQSIRDCLLLNAKTGMHQSELMRLAGGQSKIVEIEGEEEIAGTITFIHKSGYVHTVSVDRQSLRAAQRFQKRGSAPSDAYIRKVIDRTAKKSGLEPIRFGELRHSFAARAGGRAAAARTIERGRAARTSAAAARTIEAGG